MDYKKLINILIKDIGELDELIAELKQNQKLEPIDIEYIHTRIRGIRQIAEMLADVKTDVQHSSPVSRFDQQNNGFYTPEQQTANEDTYASDEEIVKEAESNVTVVVPSSVKLKNTSEEIQSLSTSETTTEIISHKVIQSSETDVKFESKEIIQEITTEETILLEESEKEEHKVLGEKFTKEKSLNELLSDQSKLESKLTNMPISNLQSAIGINDRFLYIRELFGGDTNRFDKTVRQIDSFATIYEAIEFLKENFQWKSNETSKKFLSLVKRRFSNE